MSADVGVVFEAAESLPVAQRRELIELLKAGLNDDVPPRSDAWRRVIAALLADYDAGHVEAVPWTEARMAMLPASGVA